METLESKIIVNRQKILRHKLQKHVKLQKFSTAVYLQYCSLTGFLHVLPNFLIIGFVKCGTTSMYQYLIKHPNVYAPTGKEIDYFDRLYARGINWYKNKFPFRTKKFFVQKLLKKDFITGEATPRYIEHPHALKRIKNTLPHTKFIVLLRNPIDRAYSHYNQNLHLDYEFRSFEDALTHEQERIKGRFIKMQQNEHYYSWDYDLYGYLEHGMYVNKLEIWLREFPREQFLFIQTEEFLKNTETIYRQALEFLNLSPLKINDYKRYKEREYKNSKIDTALRKKLVEYFKPHNEKLYELLGTNFHWDE